MASDPRTFRVKRNKKQAAKHGEWKPHLFITPLYIKETRDLNKDVQWPKKQLEGVLVGLFFLYAVRWAIEHDLELHDDLEGHKGVEH